MFIWFFPESCNQSPDKQGLDSADGGASTRTPPPSESEKEKERRRRGETDSEHEAAGAAASADPPAADPPDDAGRFDWLLPMLRGRSFCGISHNGPPAPCCAVIPDRSGPSIFRTMDNASAPVVMITSYGSGMLVNSPRTPTLFEGMTDTFSAWPSARTGARWPRAERKRVADW